VARFPRTQLRRSSDSDSSEVSAKPQYIEGLGVPIRKGEMLGLR